MKRFLLIVPFLVTSAVYANSSPTCHEKCFQAKHKCNTTRGHTFNDCAHDLFACQASCKTGEKQEKYSSKGMEVGFTPVVDFNMVKLVKYFR